MNRVMGSDKDTQRDLEGLPVHVLLSTTVKTYQMKASDNVISIVSATGADDTGIVTLPSLAEAVGKFYYIVAPTGSTGNDISLYEKETGVSHAKGDMDADGDYVLLYSNGVSWMTIADNGQ